MQFTLSTDVWAIPAYGTRLFSTFCLSFFVLPVVKKLVMLFLSVELSSFAIRYQSSSKKQNSGLQPQSGSSPEPDPLALWPWASSLQNCEK